MNYLISKSFKHFIRSIHDWRWISDHSPNKLNNENKTHNTTFESLTFRKTIRFLVPAIVTSAVQTLNYSLLVAWQRTNSF